MPPARLLGVADDLAPAPIPALFGVYATPMPPILGVFATASFLIFSAFARSILINCQLEVKIARSPNL